MKKFLSALLALTMIFALCASGTAYAADEKVYTLKVSHTQGDTAPVVMGLYEFERLVEERSGGRMQIEVFTNGSLGDTTELVAQCLAGSNIGFMTDSGRFSDFVPEIGILNAPYVIETYEEGSKAVQSDYFNGLVEQLKGEGYQMLSFNYYEGGRHILTNKPVTCLDEVKGVKLRTGGTPEWVGTLDAFGAIPTSLAQSDVYNGIQNKIVDGADQQIITVYGMQLYEVAPYYIMTNQYQLMLGLCVSTSWFETIPEDLQQLLIDCSIEAGEYSSMKTNEVESKYVEEMVNDYGLKVVELDEAGMQEWKDAAESFYEENPEYKEWREKIFAAIGK